MIEHFNITSIGYSHVKADKVCQDHSLSYFDGERTIITACDGHGGDVYIRSHKGSKFASLATLRAMLDAESLSFASTPPRRSSIISSSIFSVSGIGLCERILPSIRSARARAHT